MKSSKTLLSIALVSSCVVLASTSQAQSMRTPWNMLTPQQLTAVWWQWATAIPWSVSAWNDQTGANAFSGQPYFTAPGGPGQLLFLAGTTSSTYIDGNVYGVVTRAISVKQGTTIFFPTINCDWDNTYISPHLGGSTSWPISKPLSIPELRDLCLGFVESATDVYANVTPTDSDFTPNGATVPLDVVMLESPPFAYKLPRTDNVAQELWGLNISGTVAPVFAVGLWVTIPGGSLPPGDYLLEFGGQAPLGGPLFIEEITYHITITP